MREEELRRLFEKLFAAWYTPLVRYAYRATRSLATAEDVVQESFKELYRTLVTGKGIDSPEAWTLCVVRRQIIRQVREQSRQGGAFRSLTELGDIARPANPEPLAEWRSGELSDYLKVLTSREEEVLLLRLKPMKYQQIASALGISTNSVKTLLARAVRKMQQARNDETSGSLDWDEDVEINRRPPQ